MSVPKGRRQESRFEAWHHFYQLRKEVTNLILNDFSFSEDKYRKQMLRYRQFHQSAGDVDAVCEKWENKCESFHRWYIDAEANAIIDLLRRISQEFTIGNSIFPSGTHAKLFEFLQRRWHLNRAIGNCYALKQEIQYVIETLPVDINKYQRFAEMIDRQIALFKGVRQASNKMIKANPKHSGETLSGAIERTFDGIAAIIRKVGKIESEAGE